MTLPAMLWTSLFESAGQTLAGIVGSYAASRAAARYRRNSTFDGAMDLWLRGIGRGNVDEDDQIRFDGLISPYTQLFPADPLMNAKRWNQLYDFSGSITSSEYQSMEFLAGSDAALRVGSLNGESIVGLYARYGFVGEGLVGVVPTKLITRSIPNFFSPEFIGARALVKGRLSKCPSQHGFVVQAIAQKAGISLPAKAYRSTWYLKIDSVSPAKQDAAKAVSLLGSMWAATEVEEHQYLVQYGYLTNPTERRDCVRHIMAEPAWSLARVFCDDLDSPSEGLSFKRAFL